MPRDEMAPPGAPDGATRVAASAPAEPMLRRARLMWEQGQADLKEARRLLRARSYLDSAFFSFQASINALTSVCYLHGEYRPPTHSPLRLVGVLQDYDAHFAGVGPAAEALEAVQELNPYAAERDAEDEQRRSRLYYDHSDSILKSVRGYLKRNRRRFFAP